MIEFNIRIATAEDIDEIFKIEKLCFDSSDAFPKRVFHHYLNDLASFILLAETKIESKIAGFIIISKNSKDLYEIITLNVHPDWQRKGIGTLLLDKAEDFITKKIKNSLLPRSSVGDPSIFQYTMELVVLETNEKARILYERMGYSFVTMIQNYYGKNRNGIKMIKVVNFWF